MFESSLIIGENCSDTAVYELRLLIVTDEAMDIYCRNRFAKCWIQLDTLNNHNTRTVPKTATPLNYVWVHYYPDTKKKKQVYGIQASCACSHFTVSPL